MVLICLLTLYPFINTIAYSFNEGLDANRGGIYFWPRVFSLKSYERIFSDSTIVNSFLITLIRTFIGVVVTTISTGIFAYALSKKELIGRNIYLMICVVALIFNAGLIPTYMLYKDLNLLDNFAVYILPSVINLWYMILMKTFFEQFPAELEEAAEIDGATKMGVFFKIVIPLSMPIIATICIFTGVDQWNSWFDGFLYVSNPRLQPIQTYLYRVIAQSQGSNNVNTQQMLAQSTYSIKTIQAATVVVATLPIVFIYSMFQKYFTKGVMIGAIKG
jgi:putative aldouronate transport system permease protein